MFSKFPRSLEQVRDAKSLGPEGHPCAHGWLHQKMDLDWNNYILFFVQTCHVCSILLLLRVVS